MTVQFVIFYDGHADEDIHAVYTCCTCYTYFATLNRHFYILETARVIIDA